MKKIVMSHSDVVERVAKWYDTYPYNRCSFWRSYFKKRGWKWNVIWKDLGVINVNLEIKEEYNGTEE